MARSRFYFRDGTAPAPAPNVPRMLGVATFTDPSRIIHYPDGTIVRVASFVYRVGVESFDGLRVSEESEELRFFPQSELLALDVPATQVPVLERYVPDAIGPHLE